MSQNMHIIRFPGYDALSQHAAQWIIHAVREKPSLLLCAAAGNSPKGAYAALRQHEKVNPGYFKHLKLIQLDEWLGLPQNHPASCARFIRERLATPLNIAAKNLFLFDGMAADPAAECQRADAFLQKHGPIDLCVPGIGANGHLGFNEPADAFSDRTHVTPLQHETRQHAMIEAVAAKPERGISLGIGDILGSKRVILIVSGKNKRAAWQRLQEKIVSPAFPASALWQHAHVTCLVDEEI